MFFCYNAFGQYGEKLMLSPLEIEAVFLKQNLDLLAEQMNVSIADAEIAQAKLWSNPTLSITDVNLWSTSNQREGKSELIPPLFGSFARNTQFSIELSQLIQTANKRGKLVAKEKVSKEIAVWQFELVLRGLKVELRKSIAEVLYLQNYQKVLLAQEEAINQLVSSYERQVSQGNMAKTELLRLQSSLLEIENERYEITTELSEELKTLKSLLSLDPLTILEIVDDEQTMPIPESIQLAALLEQTTELRADMQLSKLQTRYFEKSLAYEKSQRIPDVTIQATYDRYGGVWKDFIGFGFSIDLPFFHRNQGAIRVAKTQRQQSLYQEKKLLNQTQHEVVAAYTNYVYAFTFYEKTSSNELFGELDDMLIIFSKNLMNRNISMLEYIDFMEAYKNNKNTALLALKRMRLQFEELQYTVGTEISNVI